MLGLMMNRPLLISSLIEHAAQYHSDTEIVSRTAEGPMHRYTYAEANLRSKKLANALKRLGLGEGDRIATLAWNGYRHFELYYAVSGMGAVCHTINPRLFHDQIEFIVNHAEDKALFFDLTFLPMVEKLLPVLKPLKHVVLMTDRAHMPASSPIPNLLCYEELVAPESDVFDWPDLDENTASSLCYTSGTTGNPKGALYSHRSTLLHAYMCCMVDTLAISSSQSVCPVVPMFHVNAWGVPYSAAMAGARLVFPGPGLDGPSLYQLFEAEGVTYSLGVPTIWFGLLKHIEDLGARFTTLKRLLIGGSAAPAAMIETFERKYGVEAVHGWGMTEMSPVGSVGTMKMNLAKLPYDQQLQYKLKQGRALFGCELKIVDAGGKALPHDGTTAGELLVRGPWIASAYYNDTAASKAAFTKDGWFHTGDVCTIDPEGYMHMTDRATDILKSGGEWISSIALENLAVAHPDVQEAAVIGVAHPRWDERPLLIVVAKPGHSPTREGLIEFMSDKVAKWMLPDDVVVVSELPHTATGKLLKTKLRDQFRDYRWPDVIRSGAAS